MVLVDGVYCPFVGHTCVSFANETRDVCDRYAPEVLCEGRLQHRPCLRQLPAARPLSGGMIRAEMAVGGARGPSAPRDARNAAARLMLWMMPALGDYSRGAGVRSI